MKKLTAFAIGLLWAFSAQSADFIDNGFFVPGFIETGFFEEDAPPPAGITFEDSGSAAWTSGTSIDVGPAGGAAASGEVVLLAIDYVASSAGAWPSSYTLTGFTQIGQFDMGGQAGEYGQLTLFRKVAGGSEPASYTISWTGGTIDSATAGVVVYSGVDNTTPNGTVVDGVENSASTTWDIPELTTTANNSLDLAIVGSNGDSGAGVTLSGWGSSLIERLDVNSSFASVGFAGEIRASAGVQAATTVTSSVSNGALAMRVELFEAAGAGTPTFDSGPTVTVIDSNTYRLTYDADALAENIFVMLKAKDESTPTCAQVEAGTGGRGTATEATTGASDTIDIDATDSPAFALYDIYWCLKEGASNYSSLGSELDAMLAAFAGMQRITITGVSGTGVLNGSGAAAGDVLEVSLVTTPGNFDILPESDGDLNIDAGGDVSKQTLLGWFYDVSAVAWSSMAAQLVCINNATPRKGIGPYPFEISVLEDVAISPVNLPNDAVDDNGDDLTVTLQSGTLPPGLSLASNEVTGTPTDPDIVRTIQRYMDECGAFVDLQRTWITRTQRPQFIGAVANLNYPVDMAITPRDFSTEFGHDNMTPPAVTFTLHRLGSSALETLSDGAASLSRALSVDDASGIVAGNYISTESSPNPSLVLAKYGNDLELDSGLLWADNDDVFLWELVETAPTGLVMASDGELTGTPTVVNITSNMRVRALDANGELKDSSGFRITVSGPGGSGKPGGVGSLSIGHLGL